MRRGTTLVELLITLALLGMLGAIAAPRVGGLLAGAAVESAARRIAAAHTVARTAAVYHGSLALVRVTPDSLVVRTIAGADTVTIWRAPGPASESVALAGPDRPVVFSPLGLARGVSNATFRLTRGSAVRQVVVSRLGRVRVTRSP
jgi:prepilin-type N-terminal cleavage/methylation domain-containing protein